MVTKWSTVGRTFKRDSEEGKKERAVQEVGEKQGHRPQARLDGRSKHAARGPDGGLGPRGRQCAERARGAEWCRALPHAVPLASASVVSRPSTWFVPAPAEEVETEQGWVTCPSAHP